MLGYSLSFHFKVGNTARQHFDASASLYIYIYLGWAHCEGVVEDIIVAIFVQIGLNQTLEVLMGSGSVDSLEVLMGSGSDVLRF